QELGGHELDDLEHHLAGCPACRARVDEERTALADLRHHLRPPAAPDALTSNVRALLDREDVAERQATRRRRLAWALPGGASLAAAAALALFAVDSLGPAAPSERRTVSVALVEQDALASRYRAAPLVQVTSRSEAARSVGEYLRVPVTTPRFS